MNIKLDENIPQKLSPILSELGHNVDTVLQENKGGFSDEVVWSAASEENRFFITQDLDFSDTRQFKPGTHPGIVIVRLGNPSQRRLIDRIRLVFSQENIEEWGGCFVVLTERKIRIRKS